MRGFFPPPCRNTDSGSATEVQHGCISLFATQASQEVHSSGSRGNSCTGARQEGTQRLSPAACHAACDGAGEIFPPPPWEEGCGDSGMVRRSFDLVWATTPAVPLRVTSTQRAFFAASRIWGFPSHTVGAPSEGNKLKDVLNAELEGDSSRQLWSFPKSRLKLWRQNRDGQTSP